MPDVSDILADIPSTAGSIADGAQALGQPITEGALGDTELNGEHVVGHLGVRSLLDGKLTTDILRAADKADDPSLAGTAGLAHVEKLVNKHSDLLDSRTKALFDEKSAKPDLDVTDPADHKEIVSEIHNYANNPAAMLDTLDKSTAALHAVAPQIASSAQQTATRAVQFLSAKALQPAPEPLGAEYEPSPAEASKFDRYLSVVEDPTIALKQIKDGTITPETTETLAAVYPRLFEKMKESLIGGLSPETPYRIKLSMSHFLGSPLDSSLAPSKIAAIQGSFGPGGNPPAPAGAGPKPKASSIAKLDIADRTSLSPTKDED